MLEKILSLFERAVTALENIASAGKVDPQQTAPGGLVAPEAAPRQARSRAGKAVETAAPATPAADNDFLGGGPASPEIDLRKYERGDVKAALTKLVEKFGQEKAFKLFVSSGGVQSLNDLPEDKFAVVIDAANKALK